MFTLLRILFSLFLKFRITIVHIHNGYTKDRSRLDQ